VNATNPLPVVRERARGTTAKKSGTSIPEAAVRLVPPTRPGRAVLAVVDHCPYCQGRHTHGAGTDGRRPLLGTRVSHCQHGDYVLTVGVLT
jgi:hypothetical protein